MVVEYQIITASILLNKHVVWLVHYTTCLRHFLQNIIVAVTTDCVTWF